MEALFISIHVISGIFVLFTVLPLLKVDHWTVRVFDFPRLQIASLLALMIVINSIFFSQDKLAFGISLILLIWALVYQLLKILRYTRLTKHEVKGYKKAPDDNSISILVSNVLATNRNSEALLKQIESCDPDIVLTLESEKWWEEQMHVLESSYSYTVKKTLDNLYGMHLYSKLELIDPKIKFLVSDEIPSFHSGVKLRSGKVIRIHCLHPKPPSPTESDTSNDRDAELLIVAREIENDSVRTLVFGDLNDVAWSRTTRLFQKISGLLDPRVGRGFYNTFSARYKYLRWPLDHIFHSSDFMLISIKRLKDIGSDHFPMFARLQYEEQAKNHQEKPKANGDEKEYADEKIEKAKDEND